MADLLGEVDTNVVSNNAPTRSIVKSEARRKVRVLSPPLAEKRRREKVESKDENEVPSSPPKDDLALHSDDLDDAPLPPPEDDDDVFMGDPMPSSPMTVLTPMSSTILANGTQRTMTPRAMPTSTSLPCSMLAGGHRVCHSLGSSPIMEPPPGHAPLQNPSSADADDKVDNAPNDADTDVLAGL